MQNPLKGLKEKAKAAQEKLKAAVAKLKPSPEGKVKLVNRTGIVLLGGAAVATGAIFFVPAALTTIVGATALGLLGVGGGLVQEADNMKHQIWMKSQPVEAPVSLKAEPALEKKVEAPAPVVAPVAEAAPAVVEKKADITPVQPATDFAAAVEKKVEAPVATPAAAPAAKPDAPKA